MKREITCRRDQESDVPAGKRPNMDTKSRACVSCHHQALPAMASRWLAPVGSRLDEETARERIQATLARFAPDREDMFQNPLGSASLGGGALGAGYALLGLLLGCAAERHNGRDGALRFPRAN